MNGVLDIQDIPKMLEWYLAFLFSTTLHEAAHAWTAWKLGDDTARRGGQVTLDPRPHIRREPIGMVVVPLASFWFGGWMIGWASAPFNAYWAVQYPRRAGLMAIAGPLSNLCLALLAGLAIVAGVAIHLFQAPAVLQFGHMTEALNGGWAEILASVLSILLSLNLLLGIFNLLPLPPLDGASMLLLFFNRQTAAKIFGVIRHQTVQFFGIYFAWKWFGYVFRPVQRLVTHLLYPGVFY